MCPAVIGLAWLDVLPLVWGVLSPQSTTYTQGVSLTPASLKLALNVYAVPAVAVWFAPVVTVGGTLAILAAVVAGVPPAPRESVTVRVTV